MIPGVDNVKLLFFCTCLISIGACSESHEVSRNQAETEAVAVVRILAERIEIGQPLLLQQEYDKDLNVTYSVMPVQGEWHGDKVEVKKDWRFDATFDSDHQTGFATIHGDFPTKSGSHLSPSERALMAAVAAAEWEGRLTYPHVVSLNGTDKGWSVIFDRVPLVVGGWTLVRVSTDMTEVIVSPGY